MKISIEEEMLIFQPESEYEAFDLGRIIMGQETPLSYEVRGIKDSDNPKTRLDRVTVKVDGFWKWLCMAPTSRRW